MEGAVDDVVTEGSQTTYEELKLLQGSLSHVQFHRSQTTYEELKPFPKMSIRSKP